MASFTGTDTHFAHNLKLLRHFFNYEISYVAAKLNVNSERYRHWEKGKQFPNHPAYYVCVCKLYNFTALMDIFTKKLDETDLLKFYNATDL